ncbi:MAG: DNRLRE domain-containing protein, partial [Clostridia bacterium]|nr:DNRLRE domain-containing protein [Clostridia bacterium]
MKKFMVRFLTVLLSVAMLIVSLPMGVFAEELREARAKSETENSGGFSDTVTGTIGEAEAEKEVYALGEDFSLRNANTKQIRMSDGSYYLAYYDYAVHYRDENGAWEEIDNTLVSSAAADEEDISGFATVKGPMQIKFANNGSSSKLIAVKNEKYKLSFGLVGADNSKAATVVNPETEEAETELERLIHVKKSVSSVLYRDILENIDLEYTLRGTGIKENIIIKEKMDSYSFSFDMKVKNLTAELTSNGSIVLKDSQSGEIVFRISAPFMTDANGAYSEAVSYSLEQLKKGEYRLTVTPDSTWMNDESRAFPVTVDPPLEIKEEDSVEDTYTDQANPNTVYGDLPYLYAGRKNNQSMYSYWKYTGSLAIPENAVIVNASLVMRITYLDGEGLYIGAYKKVGAWSENTLIWNNQSGLSELADYQHITQENVYFQPEISWNITDLVQKWHGGAGNNGIILKPVDGIAANGKVMLSSSEDTAKPTLQVQYRNVVGLENYYTYQTQSAGRAGTGYINHHTSGLTLIRGDFSSGSEILPFSMSHVYNSANAGLEFTNNENAGIHTANFSKMKLGKGWKLSAQETLVTKVFGEKTYLVFNDSDGTEHYFYPSDDYPDTWYDEDGLGLTVTKSSLTYTMTDKGDNQKKFTNGILTDIIDANENKIVFTYNVNNQLTSISRRNKGCAW